MCSSSGLGEVWGHSQAHLSVVYTRRSRGRFPPTYCSPRWNYSGYSENKMRGYFSPGDVVSDLHNMCFGFEINYFLALLPLWSGFQEDIFIDDVIRWIIVRLKEILGKIHSSCRSCANFYYWNKKYYRLIEPPSFVFSLIRKLFGIVIFF